MEKPTVNSPNEKKSDSTNSKSKQINKTTAILIGLLICLCGYLVWQNYNLQNQINEGEMELTNVVSERNQVQAELEEMLLKYKELETNNEELNSSLTEEKEKIEALLKKVKNKDWSIYKLKKETETLRTIMKGYIVQIDSLNQLNNQLNEENALVKTELSTERGKNQSLTEKNENLSNLVTVASHLRAVNINSYAVKIKNDNTGKPTDRAKRAGKLRTEFKIQKNTITKPGNKTIYIRILTPDGKVLSEKTDDSNKFNFNGVRGLYSSKKTIDYKNEDVKLTIDWKKIEDFPIGEYTVEIYSDGVDIGRTKFSLK